MGLNDLLEHLKSRSQRKFRAKIRDDHILDEGYRPMLISPSAAYFEIRLAEMFLSYKSEYGRQFVPIAVIASDFAYGGTSRSFPFFVGTALLRDIEAYVKGEDVSFRNTRVVGPVPYTGGDVAVFVGLYRAQVDDFARKLLEVVGQLVSVFDVTRLSSYVNVAGKVADGLYSLLNFKQLEYRTGDRDVFQDHGTKLFATGYFAYVNCDQTGIELDDLWVQGGMLKVGSAPGALSALQKYDYCLLEVQAPEVRTDYTSLPFHEKWKQARDRISKGDDALAHTLFVECCREIADSPDLTPSHAEALIQAYQANYAKTIDFYGKLKKPSPEHVATVYRDPQGGMLQPQQSIMRTAQVALAAGADESALKGLVNLSKNWDALPHLDSPDAALTDAFLNKQLATIESFSNKKEANPKALANALAIAAVTAT